MVGLEGRSWGDKEILLPKVVPGKSSILIRLRWLHNLNVLASRIWTLHNLGFLNLDACIKARGLRSGDRELGTRHDLNTRRTSI